ncbi:HET-domain-containing protein, partial [Lindgomyces ingoldianus]
TSYVALSHCWGAFQTYKTEKHSLNDRLTGLSWSHIPETFQDAILITRSLGFHFIWIDSLCIVQDDLDDWAGESSRMNSVYANAALTIAAATAEDDTQGFLQRRYYASYLIPTGDNGTKIKIRRFLHDDSFDQPGPLARRGWVLQERLLSRRILYYEQDEMVWECRENRHCECGHKLSFDRNKGTPSSKTPLVDAYYFTQSSVPTSETYSWWRKWVVPEYILLQLTKLSDRLPALSGLATAMRLKSRVTYLAGIWLEDLAPSLLWRTFGHARLVIDEYIAPSWSWASLNGRVDFGPGVEGIKFVRVVEYNITITSKNPTGAISGGSLKL